MSCKIFGRLWLPRFIPLVFLVMACFALPQQATAQNSADVIVSIDNASVGEGDGSVTLTARLSRTVNQNVTLGIIYQDGTATFSDDVSGDPPAPRAVTIPANTLSADFTVFIRNDTVDEPDETLTVFLGGNSLPPETNFDFSSNSATLTIIDNDDPAPPVNNRVSISSPRPISEGAGALNFIVRTKFNVRSDVVLGVAYAGGTTNPATPADDLGADRPSTVTILAGQRSATLRVPIVNDDIVEENETFTVALSLPAENPPGHILFLDANESKATGTIIDNNNDNADPVVALSVDININNASASEGGNVGFRVTLSAELDEVRTLNLTYAPGATNPATLADDLGSSRPTTLTLPTGTTTVDFNVPTTQDSIVEENETFTVTLSVPLQNNPEAPAPLNALNITTAAGTGTITDNDDAAPPARKPSVLIEPRRIGAGTALRRHAGRFDTMTGTVVRARLRGSIMETLTLSETLGSGAAAAGGRLGKTRWGSWIDGSYGGFGGKATGRQADVYGGFDFLGGNGKWLIGALAGHERADLEIGKATYSTHYTHLGLYGGVRLSDRLVFDGALTYGMATPEVTLGDVSASYDANRITARIALTGDFGLAYGLGTGSVKVEPQVGLLYSREALGAFTDSAGGVAGGEVLELGRFSFGPRLTWDFDWGQVVGGARVQWDFLQIDDGVDGRLSGAADIGLRFGIAPGVTLGVHGDVDGIGIADGFGSLGGRVQLDARF